MDFKDLENRMIEFSNSILSNCNGAVLGLSGGLDSAIVLDILSKSNKDIHCLLMPTNSSNAKNLEDALNLLKNYKVTYKIINIDSILNEIITATCADSNIRVGNICSRIRMLLLYDYSAKHNLLVAGTTNKSELMLGYGTVFGDMACAFNLLGDLYKSELFQFARFLGIPSYIIDKKPSADLFEGQNDENDLGYNYQEIDYVLKEYELGNKCNNKYDDLINRIKKNSFKREGIKIFRR